MLLVAETRKLVILAPTEKDSAIHSSYPCPVRPGGLANFGLGLDRPGGYVFFSFSYTGLDRDPC